MLLLVKCTYREQNISHTRMYTHATNAFRVGTVLCKFLLNLVFNLQNDKVLHLEKKSAKYLLSNVGQLVGLQTPVFCEQNEHWIVKKNLPILPLF